MLSNIEFEVPKWCFFMLKLNKTLQIYVKIENATWCVLALISQLLHGQISESRTILPKYKLATFLWTPCIA